MHTHLARDFPAVVASEGDAVSLPAAGLVEALRQVVRAASSEDSRPILTGVLMAAEAGGLRLVATDSYRSPCGTSPAPGCWARARRCWFPPGPCRSCSGLLGTAGRDACGLRE